MKTELIVIRHGETEWNRIGRIQGQLDSALTPEGIVQAEACAERLAAEKIDRVVTSDSGRVLHTARILNSKLGRPMRHTSALRERCFGIGEGRTYAELEVLHPGKFSRIHAVNAEFALDGGESRRTFSERVVAAIQEISIEHAGERVLVVTHGGVLGMIYRWIKAMPVESSASVPIPNVGYNVISREHDVWSVDCWADTSHLPVETMDGV